MRDVNISISSVFSTCSAVPSRAKMQRNVQYDEFQRSTICRAVVSTGSPWQAPAAASPTPPSQPGPAAAKTAWRRTRQREQASALRSPESNCCCIGSYSGWRYRTDRTASVPAPA